ncbi:MAG TPA: hypothetical protein GXX40_02720 [Firmicutes bacterium]|nr:hypothetical protein [Bacillota bacterium]
MKYCYRVERKSERILEVSRLEDGAIVWVGRYTSERTIAGAGLVGEDGLENVCVRVEEALPGRSVRLGVVKFSEEGKLLGSLFFSDGDCHYSVWTSRLLNVGRDGSIYQVIPEKSSSRSAYGPSIDSLLSA